MLTTESKAQTKRHEALRESRFEGAWIAASPPPRLLVFPLPPPLLSRRRLRPRRSLDAAGGWAVSVPSSEGDSAGSKK